jgi:hypothetical protein
MVWIQRVQEKSLASAGARTPVIQSVVIHYTDSDRVRVRVILIICIDRLKDERRVRKNSRNLYARRK